MHKSGIFMFGVLFILSVVLAGCFQGEQSLEEIDAPQDQETVKEVDAQQNNEDEEESTDSESEDIANDTTGETVARQLYLLDMNGMVVSQTLELPKLESKEVATQVLEYLVKGGPVTPLLPNGFQAVLPEGTEVLGMNLQEDGTLVVDLSEEFKNYPAEDEMNILESMTYTLTQFDTVNKVKLMINGHVLSEMPVNGTPIVSGYSRTNGINLIDTDTIDLIDSQAVTMYFPAGYNENRYYVPVTSHVETEGDDIYRSIVQALIDGPGYNNLNMTHVFNAHTSLVEDPVFNNGVLELVFNQDILEDVEQAMISDEVMETIVRTLTEQEMVEAVDVKVENVEVIKNENGEAYSEPVTKDSFINIEKL